jgi:hypothetical protein
MGRTGIAVASWTVVPDPEGNEFCFGQGRIASRTRTVLYNAGSAAL